ncbi:MAG: hypothetical protein HZC17_08750, partial [Candidatus Omnitrophica bacterium]|nr:hypothetical protein [Candidatus Omnitrophota bacterium]
TRVTDRGLESLSRMAGLTTLNLGGTQVTDRGVEALSRMAGLTTLDLGRTQVTDRGVEALSRMAGLTTLYLWNTQVTDRGAEFLSRMAGLTTLNLGGTQVTDRGVEALQSALPNLNITGRSLGEGARMRGEEGMRPAVRAASLGAIEDVYYDETPVSEGARETRGGKLQAILSFFAYYNIEDFEKLVRDTIDSTDVTEAVKKQPKIGKYVMREFDNFGRPLNTKEYMPDVNYIVDAILKIKNSKVSDADTGMANAVKILTSGNVMEANMNEVEKLIAGLNPSDQYVDFVRTVVAAVRNIQNISQSPSLRDRNTAFNAAQNDVFMVYQKIAENNNLNNEHTQRMYEQISLAFRKAGQQLKEAAIPSGETILKGQSAVFDVSRPIQIQLGNIPNAVFMIVNTPGGLFLDLPDGTSLPIYNGRGVSIGRESRRDNPSLSALSVNGTLLTETGISQDQLKQISRTHVKIQIVNDKVQITDSSSNGTIVRPLLAKIPVRAASLGSVENAMDFALGKEFAPPAAADFAKFLAGAMPDAAAREQFFFDLRNKVDDYFNNLPVDKIAAELAKVPGGYKTDKDFGDALQKAGVSEDLMPTGADLTQMRDQMNAILATVKTGGAVVAAVKAKAFDFGAALFEQAPDQDILNAAMEQLAGNYQKMLAGYPAGELLPSAVMQEDGDTFKAAAADIPHFAEMLQNLGPKGKLILHFNAEDTDAINKFFSKLALEHQELMQKIKKQAYPQNLPQSDIDRPAKQADRAGSGSGVFVGPVNVGVLKRSTAENKIMGDVAAIQRFQSMVNLLNDFAVTLAKIPKENEELRKKLLSDFAGLGIEQTPEGLIVINLEKLIARISSEYKAIEAAKKAA